MRNDKCPICLSGDIKLMFRGSLSDVYECQKCGIILSDLDFVNLELKVKKREDFLKEFKMGMHRGKSTWDRIILK